MRISQDLLKKANIIPKLRLAVKTDKGVQGTGPHRVKLLQDKEAKDTDPMTGKEREVVSYLVEENGVKKSYKAAKLGKDGQLHYLVQRLADVEEGEEIILEYKRKGIKGFISVSDIKDQGEVTEEEVVNESETINYE